MSPHDGINNNDKPNVVVVGRYQIGKSTLINCLLDDRVASTGEGISTTKISTVYTYGQVPKIDVARTWIGDSIDWQATNCRLQDFLYPDKTWLGVSAVRISLWKPLLQKINLIDTPGVDANADDTAQAVASLDKADFVIVLLENKGLDKPEQDLFRRIQQCNKPFAVIINCWDKGGKRWFPEHNAEVVQSVSAQLSNLGHLPLPISGQVRVWPCNLLWFWHASGHIFEVGDSDIEKSKAERLCRRISEYFSYHLKESLTPAVSFAHSRFQEVRYFFENNHWEKDKDKKTLKITSSKTDDFLHKLKWEHERVANTLSEILPKCWFDSTPAGTVIRRLTAHFDELKKKNELKIEGRGYLDNLTKYRKDKSKVKEVEIWDNLLKKNMKSVLEFERIWNSSLVEIGTGYDIPESHAWYVNSVHDLTCWIIPIANDLPSPYLAFFAKTQRGIHLKTFSHHIECMKNVVASIRRDINTTFIGLQNEFRDLRAAWHPFESYAAVGRNYLDSGRFGKIFKSYDPEKLASHGKSFLERSATFVTLSNGFLKPHFQKIVDCWNSALDPLSDVIKSIANHGQDLTAVSYRDWNSVNSIPNHPSYEVIVNLMREKLDAILADGNTSDAEKLRFYCAHRRLGFSSSNSQEVLSSKTQHNVETVFCVPNTQDEFIHKNISTQEALEQFRT